VVSSSLKAELQRVTLRWKGWSSGFNLFFLAEFFRKIASVALDTWLGDYLNRYSLHAGIMVARANEI
jgi:hypothetical protein